MRNQPRDLATTVALALTCVVALGCGNDGSGGTQNAGGALSSGSGSGGRGGAGGDAFGGSTAGSGGKSGGATGGSVPTSGGASASSSGGSTSGGRGGAAGETSGGSPSSGRAGATGGTSGVGPSGGRAGATGGTSGVGPSGGRAGAGGSLGGGPPGGRGGTAGATGTAGAGGNANGGATGAVSYDWVLTAFTNQSESNMFVYRSTDGLRFELVKGPAFTPPSGQLVRDPSVILRADGRYYLAYTTGWRDKRFGIAYSTDLVAWTPLTTVPTLSNATSSWAPEWFVEDGVVHVIISISTTGNGSAYGNFSPYLFTAKSEDLMTWDGGVKMTGIEPNYIDTFVVHSGATYHAFTKNENTKVIEHATASALAGPYTLVGKGDWAGWGNTAVEGPCLFQLGDGTWRMLVDGYTSSQYLYSDSQDLERWSKRQVLPGGLSGVIRHGTVLRREVKRTVAAP